MLNKRSVQLCILLGLYIMSTQSYVLKVRIDPINRLHKLHSTTSTNNYQSRLNSSDLRIIYKKCQTTIIQTIMISDIILFFDTEKVFSFSKISSSSISRVYARNLPEENGASGTKIGTVVSLKPILQIKGKIDKSLRFVSSNYDNFLLVCTNGQTNTDTSNCDILFNELLKYTEKDFKRTFDEYSQGVSYKQQYLDKNAFLTYYTQGFDGINRESIEADKDGSMTKMTMQYGYRNEAWIALNDAVGEIKYIKEQLSSKQSTASNNDDTNESKKDLLSALKTTQVAFQNYLELAPSDQVAEAKLQLHL